MRKFILVAGLLAPVLASPAFAGGFGMAGDLNAASTSASSNAGVSSTQGTGAQAKAGGNGAVIVGTVSGNYTSVDTSAVGKASPFGSYTNTSANQVNVGGTISGGIAGNIRGGGIGPSYGVQGNGASGSTGGGQNSQATGNASASAHDMNIGGGMAVSPGHRRGGVVR